MGAKTAGGKGAGRDLMLGSGKTLEETVQGHVATAMLEAALIIATASRKGAKGKAGKKKAAARKGSAKKAASKKGTAKKGERHSVPTGEHGEIILPAEVSEGLTWVYRHAPMLGKGDTGKRDGRK